LHDTDSEVHALGSANFDAEFRGDSSCHADVNVRREIQLIPVDRQRCASGSSVLTVDIIVYRSSGNHRLVTAEHLQPD
jgi:hypothetical protein